MFFKQKNQMEKKEKKVEAEKPPTAPADAEAAPEEERKELEEELASLIILDKQNQAEQKIRMVSLYGDIDEEKGEEACFYMMALKKSGKEEYYNDPKDPLSGVAEVHYMPMTLFVSTVGGTSVDMFAIYDTMRMIREDCEVHTIGMGKVMSAGVLLLAGGTKGHRKIGKNCRVMLHSVIGGNHGPIHNLENEMDELRWVQQRYVEAMVEETNMTKKYLTKLLDRKVNAYLGAQEAVELGIADEII